MQIVHRPFQWSGVADNIELEFYKCLAKSGTIRTVFDIGARNSKMPYIFDNTCHIYMFEPNPRFYEQLRNELASFLNTSIYDFGIGDVDGTIPYYQNTESFIERKVHVQSKNPIMLPMKSFQNTVSELNVPSIDFLKIDTEGGEYSILKNAQPYIHAKKIKFIQFEIGGTIFDIKENLYDIFGLFDRDWTVYNMETGVLNKMSTAFTWEPNNYGNSNLLATWLAEEELSRILNL